MIDYLRYKWRKLRLYRRKNGFAVDYLIIKQAAKLYGDELCR